MRHYSLAGELLLGLVAVFLFAADVQAEGSHSRPFLLVEDPWPPYTFGEAGTEPSSGLIVDLMQELFQRINQPVVLALHPWKRCLHMVQNQKADGLMLTVKTAEREQFLYFPEPFFVNKILFYHRADRNFSWDGFKDLQGLTIGLVNGAKYSQEFQKAIEQYHLKTEPVSTIEMNLHKLKAGRIDITPILDVVAAQTIADNQDFFNIFTGAEKPLRTTPMQMAISRSSDLMGYTQEINETIEEMKADGTVETLYNQYVPEQPEAETVHPPTEFMMSSPN